MRDKLRNVMAMLAAVGASLPWGGILPASLSLLGLAGSATATLVAGWMTPFLIGLSVVLLGRSFYILYVQKRGTRPIKVLTWLSATFVISFWTWRFLFNPSGSMSTDRSTSWAVGSVAFLLVGCGTKPATTPAEAIASPAANTGRITLQVKGMTKLLKLDGRDGPNRVEKALVGLPSIAVFDVDFQSDLLHLTYDPKKVTPEAMLETIQQQGFQGRIVPGEGTAPEKGTQARLCRTCVV